MTMCSSDRANLHSKAWEPSCYLVRSGGLRGDCLSGDDAVLSPTGDYIALYGVSSDDERKMDSRFVSFKNDHNESCLKSHRSRSSPPITGIPYVMRQVSLSMRKVIP